MKNQSGIWIGGGVILVAAVILLFVFSSPAPTPANTTANGGSATSTQTNTPSQNTGSTGSVGIKPVVVTTGFASVTSTTAVVVGTVVPESSETTYWFQYGTTLDFGSATETKVVAPGTVAIGAAAYITGLTPNTQYYFRIAAKNSAGIIYSGPYRLLTNAK